MGTNYIDSLLASIEDESVKERLTKEVNKLRENKEFGLVFERHIPEYVRLPQHKITEGATVQIRAGEDDEIYVVRSIEKKKATIIDSNDETKTMATKDLIIVSRHGDPIFPGLTEVGRVEEGGDKPFHTVINAENYHALQLLLYTHEEKVDCIYIDPPYNTGAKDWKYNNDYVDSEDRYRHSKWLSFMEKRLKLAKRLLNPEDSILIVTIDEKEYLRLGMLLEQIFPQQRIQRITDVINQSGVARPDEFARADESIFFVFFGNASPIDWKHNMLDESREEKSAGTIWRSLQRAGTNAQREDRPNLFYPIWVNSEKNKISQVGENIPLEQQRENTPAPNPKLVAVWPIRSNGTEGNWQVGPQRLRELINSGYAKLGSFNKKRKTWAINYLRKAELKRIADGELILDGKDKNGAYIIKWGESGGASSFSPVTVWNMASHNAGNYGSSLLGQILPGRKFPFPKSLYAVEDTLRFFIADKPEAVVVDFFAGSGTTTHAVMRLNKQDNGRRVSISITNNAVSNKEETSLKDQGYGPNDVEWEALGIYEYITIPRITSAITGNDSDGGEIQGEYKFTDIFPISDGFEENVRFLKLEYNDSDNISRNKSFSSVSHILWLISGCTGLVIDEVADTFTLQPEGRYGILFDITYWQEFVDAVKEVPTMTHVFIITDSKVQYQQIVNHLTTNIYATMLYEDYLRNFQIGV